MWCTGLIHWDLRPADCSQCISAALHRVKSLAFAVVYTSRVHHCQNRIVVGFKSYMVINSTHVHQHMRVTISCRYALSFMGRCFFLVFLLITLRVRNTVLSRVHSSNKHCVAVYRPISTRFSAFFQKGLFFQRQYLVRIFDARWRHNFREIAVKNCEKSKNRRKSLCAPLRIDTWGIWKNSTAVV